MDNHAWNVRRPLATSRWTFAVRVSIGYRKLHYRKRDLYCSSFLRLSETSLSKDDPSRLEFPSAIRNLCFEKVSCENIVRACSLEDAKDPGLGLQWGDREVHDHFSWCFTVAIVCSIYTHLCKRGSRCGVFCFCLFLCGWCACAICHSNHFICWLRKPESDW